MKAQKRNRDWVHDYFFLFVPKPLEDELLSSWLTRMAIEHRRPLSIFLSLYVRHEGSAISRTDIDFLYDRKLLDTLACKSSLFSKDILQMSLRSEEGHLFVCNDCLYPPRQIRKLIDKRTHHGLMYCPKCLAEDKVPYFRKKWRYTFYNVCPKHKVFLTDRCWSCYERINLSKIKHLKELCFCSKCEYNLRATFTLPVSSHLKYGVKAVKWFEGGLKRGYFSINKQKIKSLFVFEVYTKLYSLLDRKEKLVLDGFPLLEDYKFLCKKLTHYSSKKTSQIYKDFFLTSMIYHLFQKYPKNFLSFSKNNHLTHRDFMHGFKNAPYWYKKMIDGLIPMENKRGRKISESEVISAINFLQSKGEIVNQLNIANIIGCHFTIHKGFVEIYHSISKAKI